MSQNSTHYIKKKLKEKSDEEKNLRSNLSTKRYVENNKDINIGRFVRNSASQKTKVLKELAAKTTTTTTKPAK